MPIYCPPLPALPPPCPHTSPPFLSRSASVRRNWRTRVRLPRSAGPVLWRANARQHNCITRRDSVFYAAGQDVEEKREKCEWSTAFIESTRPGLPRSTWRRRRRKGAVGRAKPNTARLPSLLSLLRLSLPGRTVAHGTPARIRERTHTVRVYCICCRVHRSLLFRLTVCCKQEAFYKIVFVSFRVC